MRSNLTQDNLDPRRRPRGARTRDFRSMTAMISIPRLQQLLATTLVRLGLLR